MYFLVPWGVGGTQEGTGAAIWGLQRGSLGWGGGAQCL